jgi:hypothetical protein
MKKLFLIGLVFVISCASRNFELPSVTQDSGVDSGIQDSGTIPDSSIICGEVKVKTLPVTPNVIVIVDQSGSMKENFDGDKSRWQSLRDYLLATNGLISTYQSKVNFGLVLFSGTGPKGETCPFLTQVLYSVNNFEAISNVYSVAEPLNDTPTGDSIDQLVATWVPSTNPTVFILATDGEPDTCEKPNPQEGQAEALAAINNAYSKGITTYVLAVAKEKELSQEHVNAMANAGQGLIEGAKSYRVTNNFELGNALEEIVSGEISCIIPIDGKVVTKEPCKGTVTLNGSNLLCETDNGWFLKDRNIELKGEACAKLKLGGELTATFPCGTVIVH